MPKRKQEVEGWTRPTWGFLYEDWGVIIIPSINEKKRLDSEVKVRVIIQDVD